MASKSYMILNSKLRFMTTMAVMLLVAALLPQGAAATGSGSARPTGGKWPAILGLLEKDMEFGLVKRQATTTAVASTPPPAATTTGAAGTTTAPAGTTTPVGTTTAISDTLPPSASSPVTSPSNPSSPSDISSTTSTSTSVDPSVNVTSPAALPTPAPAPASSTTITGPATTTPGSNPGESVNSTATTSTVLSSTTPGSTDPASNGTTTGALLPPGGPTPNTGESTITATSNSSILSPPSGETGVTNGTSPTSTGAVTTSTMTSYSLSYEFQTVTDSQGSESISISTISIPETTIPTTIFAGPAPSAAPLVVQQCLPDTSNPQVTLDYLPQDVWSTTGDSTSTNQTSSSTQGSSRPPHPSISSLCNNGTKAANKVGAAIHLTFTGTEVSLLMVPGINGGAYDIKLDDEDPVTLNNYKPDATSCEVSAPWNRTGLVNKPHDVTIIVKGSAAGSSSGGSQVEFNGLIFKGPKADEPSTGTNKWIIIGVSIGGAVLVIALIVILVICVKRKRNARAAAESAGPSSVVPFPGGATSPRPQTIMSGHTRSESNFSATPYNPNVSSPQQQAWQIPSGHARSQSDATSFQQQAWSPPTHSRNLSEGPLMQGQQQAPWHSTSPVMSNAALGNTYPVTQSSPPPRQSFAGYGNGQERQSFGQERPSFGQYPGPERQSFGQYPGPERQSFGQYPGPERQSHAQSHNRATSYASDARNPFE